MERYRKPEIRDKEKALPEDRFDMLGFESSGESFTVAEQRRRAEEIVSRLEKEYKKKTWRRRFGGAGLFSLGLGTTILSLLLLLISLAVPSLGMPGFLVLLAGAGMTGGGLAFMLRRPKLKDTNQALMIALKNDNWVTVSRLALEMDIPFEKAERIIKELVQAGIAEIDLHHKDAQDALVYKIKGL